LGSRLDTAPERQFLTEPFGLAQQPLRGALVVPETGLSDVSVQLRQTLLFSLEVKDAPMSPGSAGPGRGSRPAPLGAASRVLEKDRAELYQAQGALAPGDDGVHAGAVDVVGTDSAVAIAVQGSRITTIPAISLTGDEIDECRFLCLLHYSPLSVTAIAPREAATR
jgi:hypothetical protein